MTDPEMKYFYTYRTWQIQRSVLLPGVNKVPTLQFSKKRVVFQSLFNDYTLRLIAFVYGNLINSVARNFFSQNGVNFNKYIQEYFYFINDVHLGESFIFKFEVFKNNRVSVSKS